MPPTNQFDLILPEQRLSGAIFASPHSGREYCRSFLKATALDAHTLRSSEDAYVDELIEAAPLYGIPTLCARTPRCYVDLNRSAEELDPALIEGVRRGSHNPRVTSGLGVIPRVVANGRAIYRGRIQMTEAQRRLAAHWRPYHDALQGLIDDQKRLFGRAILVDCHSMPHEAIESHSQHMARVPHVVLGDRFGASASPDIVAVIEQVFASEGLVVARNSPFAGAYISQHYGRPARGQHVVQIEVDRSLYMNEITLERHEGFYRLRKVMLRVVQAVALLGQPRMPLAAE